MKSLICLILMGSSIVSFAEDSEKEQEPAQKESAATQVYSTAFEKAALGTVTGIVYLGKGIFRVVFETLKAGLEVTKVVFIDIPETLLKVAFFISGGYVLLTAWRLARFFGLRKFTHHDLQQSENCCHFCQ